MWDGKPGWWKTTGKVGPGSLVPEGANKASLVMRILGYRGQTYVVDVQYDYGYCGFGEKLDPNVTKGL